MSGVLGSSWRDHDDRPVEVPPVPGSADPAFYRLIGDFQGAEYRRNAFAAGTAEELAALRDLVTSVRDRPLGPTDAVLDVGCGDARHLRALVTAVPGVRAVGVDVSPALIDAGRAAAGDAGIDVALTVGDARELTRAVGDDAPFDVVWTLCQGAVGTSPVTDPQVLAQMAALVRPGGVMVVTLFHALFAARHLAPGDAFDPVHLFHHQRAEVRGPEHARRSFDLWTASYTVREAVRLVEDTGLEVSSVRGVEPGSYGRRAAGEVGLDDPELLLVAHRST